MVTPDNGKISPFQLYAIGVLTIIGININSLPRLLAKEGGTNGYLAIVISSGLFFAVVAMIYNIYRQTGKSSFFEATSSLVGRAGTYVIMLIFFGYTLMAAAFQLREFNEIARNLLLEDTPRWAIIGLFLFVACFMLPKGIDVLGRTFEILLMVFALFFLLQFLIVVPGIKPENMLPVMNISYDKFLKTIYYTLFSFAGVEMFLIFIPFVNARIKAGKYVYTSIASVAAIYIVIEILVIGKYGVEFTKTLNWPVMNLAKDVYVQEAFIENPVVIAMVLLIVTSFTTVAAYLYGAYAIVEQTVKVKGKWALTVIIGLLVYVIASIPKGFEDVEKMGDYLARYYMPLVAFIIPSLLFILACFKQRGERKDEV